MYSVLRSAVCGCKGSGPLVPKRVGDILLLEVVPYYLKWLDGVSVLFPVSHRENSEHRGFVQYWILLGKKIGRAGRRHTKRDLWVRQKLS